MTTTPTPASQPSSGIPAFSCAKRAAEPANERVGCLTHCGEDKICPSTWHDMVCTKCGTQESVSYGRGKKDDPSTYKCFKCRHSVQPSPARSDKDAERAAFDAWFDGVPEKERMTTLLAGNRMVSLTAWLARSAQESASSSDAAIWEAVTRLERQDSTYAERTAAADGLRALARRATAGTTAPTEAEAVEGGASALRAEPAGQHEADKAARAWMESHGYGNQSFGFALADLQARIEDRDREGYALAKQLMAAKAELSEATRCRAEGGVTCNNSSSELASNTATAAPGDLPPLPEPFGELKYQRADGWIGTLSGFTVNQMREYGRACIASNAGAAPGLTATHGPLHLTNRKTAEIAARGYNIVGYVLRSAGGDEVCLSAESAVRWLPQAHYWRLTHEQDGSLFAAPSNSPAGAQTKAEDYTGCCDTPNLCSATRRCTAKDAAKAGAKEQTK